MATYEEAYEKYGIAVPPPEVFYSQEYINYFSTFAPETINPEMEQYRQFHEMYIVAQYITFTKPFQATPSLVKSSSREAVVLGGQAGAGKTALSILAIKEFEEKGKHIYLIDDDLYRALYPRRGDLLEEFPEHFTKISAIGSSNITPRILDFAVSNGLNFIFDGTMKNPRILRTSEGWRDYTINWKIMATSRLESLISVAERNQALKREKTSRLITVDIHNEMFDGLQSTVEELESLPNPGRIQIYTRGDSVLTPNLIYDSNSKTNIYSKPSEALRAGRVISRQETLSRGIGKRLDAIRNDDNLSHDELVIIEEIDTYARKYLSEHPGIRREGQDD